MTSPYLNRHTRNLLLAQLEVLRGKLRDDAPVLEMLPLALEINRDMCEGTEWVADEATRDALEALRDQLSEVISDYLVPVMRCLGDQAAVGARDEWVSDNPGVRAPRDDRR